MRKVKNFFKKVLKRDSFLYKLISSIYHFLSTTKYKLTNGKKIYLEKKHYSEVAREATTIINSFNNEDYIVFYNPTWLGVAASTKGLFKNYIPLEHVYNKNDIKNICRTVVDNKIKTIIFSQLCDGWTELISGIKELNQDIIIKVIWHGNCYEFFSDFTWELNKKVMELYNEGKVDSFGFVRSTMYEFYKRVGFKSYYLQNNVFLKRKYKDKKHSQRIGIYNADTRELKNIYTALSAIRMVPNSTADIVPINSGASDFARLIELNYESLNDYIPNEELMERISQNALNIYPTFTENSPMFPLESFEAGVPCLLGNNNDYFSNTKLGEYVILDKEDDPLYIKDRIENALKNRELIMKLYKDWKKEYDLKCEELVNDFIR